MKEGSNPRYRDNSRAGETLHKTLRKRLGLALPVRQGAGNREPVSALRRRILMGISPPTPKAKKVV